VVLRVCCHHLHSIAAAVTSSTLLTGIGIPPRLPARHQRSAVQLMPFKSDHACHQSVQLNGRRMVAAANDQQQQTDQRLDNMYQEQMRV
jgi:hypothetical protein